jgi:hypothetical protein
MQQLKHQMTMQQAGMALNPNLATRAGQQGGALQQAMFGPFGGWQGGLPGMGYGGYGLGGMQGMRGRSPSALYG